MKHSFNNAKAVCHEFVHNYKENDNIHCSNVFSDGNILYSYSTHFPMCKVIEIKVNKVKQEVFLINNNSYSSTTVRHISHLRSTIPSYYKKFYVNNPTASHLSNFRRMMKEVINIFDEIQASKQQRKKDRLLVELDSKIVSIKEFVLFFKVKSLKLSGLEYQLYHKDINADNITVFEDAKKKEVQRLKRKQVKDNKERIEQYNKDVKLWLSGEREYINTPSYIDEIHFRLSQNKKYIETSKSAYIKLTSAIRLFRDYNNNCCVGNSYGGFMVVSCDNEYIVIGCHKIPTKLFKKYGELLTNGGIK